jgi:hypothetical protein
MLRSDVRNNGRIIRRQIGRIPRCAYFLAPSTPTFAPSLQASVNAIISARRPPEDLRQPACGRMLFTPHQAEMTRGEVRAHAQDAAADLASAKVPR